MSERNDQGFEAICVDKWDVIVGVPVGASVPKVLVRIISGNADIQLSFTLDDFFRFRDDIQKAGYISADGKARMVGKLPDTSRTH